MGQLTQTLIRRLREGGDPAREVLLDVSELLRKAWHPGFVSAFQELQAEEISAAEAGDLRQALADYFEGESSPRHRRRALTALAKQGLSDLKGKLVPELHLALETHRQLSWELFQLLLALEDVGESVYPPDKRSRSLDDVQDNVQAASEYLRRHGIIVPY